jgi:hypothetical protein
MPTGDQTYTTVIALNGKVDNLMKAFGQVEKATSQIINRQIKLEKAAKQTGEAIEKAMGAAAAKIKSLGAELKEMMLPLLGITAAFKGFTSLGDLIQVSIDKFRTLRAETAAYKAIAAGFVGPARAGAIERRGEARRAEAVGLFGGIYGPSLFRTAQLKMISEGMDPNDPRPPLHRRKRRRR